MNFFEQNFSFAKHTRTFGPLCMGQKVDSTPSLPQAFGQGEKPASASQRDPQTSSNFLAHSVFYRGFEFVNKTYYLLIN